MDAVYGDENEIIQKLKDTFEKDGNPCVPDFRRKRQGIKELLYCVSELLDQCSKEPVVDETEFDPGTSVSLRMSHTRLRWPTTVHSLWKDRDREDAWLYEYGFREGIPFLPEVHEGAGHFQRPGGQPGIEDGDTVRMYGFEFDYYK